MSFTDQFETDYRWRLNQGAGAFSGLEHLHINSVENNVIISSVVIGDEDGAPFGVNYTIICAANWTVRAFNIENTNGNSLSMNADGEGNWFHANGETADKFKGAIDIDLSGTPFTNTLAIRRFKSPKAGNNQRFKMLYVPFDTLIPKLVSQQYTCLIPFKKYRYESRTSDFVADLEVDENAVVKDYPTVFTREYLDK